MVFSPVLVGGPWNCLILTIDAQEPPPELRFPDVGIKDIDGKPSICAPRPTSDGPHLYRLDGKNLHGDPVYRHVPGTT